MNQDECEIRMDAPKTKVKVRILVAPRAQPFDESMDSLLACMSHAQKAGYWVILNKVRRGCPGYHNIAPALAAMHNDPEATHLLLMADDMIYPDDLIVRLVNDDKDIVSGIYRKNYFNRLEPANFCESLEKWTECYASKGVYETKFAAGHTMLIKREVIEKMITDYPELAFETLGGETHYGLFIPMITDRVAYQDDWSFSVRARQSGFKIWSDFGCQCFHFVGDFLGFEPQAEEKDGKQ